MAKSKRLLIDDETAPGLQDVLNPKGFGHGYDPTSRATEPVEMAAPPSEMKLIPKSEWSARIKERKEQKATGRDLRNRMADGKKHKSLDQNGQGYCWAYSVTSTVMFANAVAHKPYQRLSAHAVACKIKGFRDQGGWCGLSAAFVRGKLQGFENYSGIPTTNEWPEKSMSRSYDKPETWEAAKQNTITEDWVDLTKPVYDQNLTFEMVATCLLLGEFCAVDFNWWSHSVMALDLVEIEPGSFGLDILNSWTDGWGDEGIGTLRGSKAIMDGAISTRVTLGG